MPAHSHGEYPIFQLGKSGVAHALGQSLDDGQAQTGVLSGAHLVTGVKALKYPGQVLLGEVGRIVGEGGDKEISFPEKTDSQRGAPCLRALLSKLVSTRVTPLGSASTGGRPSSSSTST